MSDRGWDDFALDDLTLYMNQLSYETISRNPSAPIHFAPLQSEQRVKLLIDADDVLRRRASKNVKGLMKGWTLWTIANDLVSKSPEPHLSGETVDSRGRSVWQTTSEVIAIAKDLSCVFTVSGSLYELADERPEMSNEGFVHVVTVLNYWGYQRALNLPPLFY